MSDTGGSFDPTKVGDVIHPIAHVFGVKFDNPWHLVAVGAVVVGLYLCYEYAKARVTEWAKISPQKANPHRPTIPPRGTAHNARLLLDRFFPRLHVWLAEHGLLDRPTELSVVNEYLRRFCTEMESLNRDYLPLDARDLGHSPALHAKFPTALRGDYVRKVRQVIRVVLDEASSGYQTTARLASVNRRSRIVRNLLRELLLSRYPLILLGDPGIGKSMTLREAGKRLAEKQLRCVYPKVTVYVRLGDLETRAAITMETIRTFIINNVPLKPRTFLNNVIDERRLVVLFDGMDEMSREHYGETVKALSDFAESYVGYIKCLFSCRINDFSPEFRHRQLVLLPFDRGQIRDFVAARIGSGTRIGLKTWTAKQVTKYLLDSHLADQNC
jgi:NACHT domain